MGDFMREHTGKFFCCFGETDEPGKQDDLAPGDGKGVYRGRFRYADYDRVRGFCCCFKTGDKAIKSFAAH